MFDHPGSFGRTESSAKGTDFQLSDKLDRRKSCVMSACDNWFTAVCHSNRGDTLQSLSLIRNGLYSTCIRHVYSDVT